MMNSLLNPYTLDALRYKKSIASDMVAACLAFEEDAEVVDQWILVKAQCGQAINKGTIQGLQENPLAMEELSNYLLNHNEDKKEVLAINVDLCRAGFYEVYDPNSVATRRLKTLKVDGVKYCI